MRHRGLIAILLVVIVGAGFAIRSHAKPSEDAKQHVRLDLAGLALPDYDRQRVVYQENEGDGWFGHHFASLIGSLENHVAAVGVGNVDIRVILQGKGLDLLREPNALMRARIDALRVKGVRFIVCRNSLVETATEPSELYGVTQKDIVRAGVAEIAELETKGFVYMRP